MKIATWTTALVLIVPTFAPFDTADSQTLDEQVEFYLANKCANLGFVRDGAFEILPGQAGPNLFAFCTGPLALPSGGPSITFVGGGSGVAAGSDRTAGDAALRRRRERQRRDSESQQLGATPNTGVFTSLDYAREQQDTTRYEGGRDGDRYIASLGLDHRFGRSVVAGIVARGEKLTGNFATGGDFESNGLGVSAYASWYTVDGLFVELSAGGDARSQHSHRVVRRKLVSVSQSIPPVITIDYTPAQIANGNSDSQERSGDLLIGYDVPLGRFTVGPRLGAAWRRSTVDPYAETGATPMSLAYDTQQETSLRSSIGLQASAAFSGSAGVAVPQLTLLWHREFRDDQHMLTAYFAEDLRSNRTQLSYFNEAPDGSTYTARLSVAAVFKGGLNAFASLQNLFGHDYQHKTEIALGFRWEL